EGELGRVKTAVGDLSVSDPHGLGSRAGYIMVRPESVEILPLGTQGVNCIDATVIRRVFVGERTEYEFVTSSDTTLSAVAPSYIDLPVGHQVTLQFKPERSVLIERD
ncbi:MAG: TOBE domain-containing protein, partial [Burkholderiaceae bacterium]|nr:TOBE domain-containing protein [Burkholderiaceae bacterium]